jgi:hypothetical protein
MAMASDPTETPPSDDLEKQATLQKAQAEARKAAADASQAEAAAAKAQFENDQAQTPDAMAAADAKNRKDAAEADQAAAAARQAQIAALIPDFSKVSESKLDVKGDQTLFGAAMAQRALDAVAADLAKTIVTSLTSAGAIRLLVTSDTDLATSDGAYVDVTTSLNGLLDAAKELLPQAPAQARAAAPRPAFAAAPLAGAIAGALPALLSLFSADRTIQSATTTVSDFAATAAVIGALRAAEADWTLVHDDVRTMPSGGAVATLVKNAAITHRELSARSAELKGTSANAADVTKLDDLAKAIDTYLGAISAVPKGATQSQLSRAILREQLHTDEDRFTHVLVAKSNGGSLDQATDNKPLWFKDRFSVVAVISVTYLLIETPSGHAVTGATIARAATGHGTIGSTIQLS